MARRVEHVEADALDLQLVPVGDPHRHHVDLALISHHGDAARAVAERAQAGDVIRMQMGIDRFHQLQVELIHQLQVAVDLFENRIQDQGIAAAPAGQEIAVGSRHAVEQLAEDHGARSPGPQPRSRYWLRQAGPTSAILLRIRGRRNPRGYFSARRWPSNMVGWHVEPTAARVAHNRAAAPALPSGPATRRSSTTPGLLPSRMATTGRSPSNRPSLLLFR